MNVDYHVKEDLNESITQVLIRLPFFRIINISPHTIIPRRRREDRCTERGRARRGGNSLLLGFELFGDGIRNDFAPIDFRARDRQLSSQSLEGCVRHRLVVLRYCRLVILLAVLHYLDDLLGCLHLVRDDDRLAALLRRHQLDISILIVVDLQQPLESLTHISLRFVLT